MLYFFFFFSAQDLRAPLADHRETLPRDRKLVQFYNLGHNILGASPPKKKNWGKNLQN